MGGKALEQPQKENVRAFVRHLLKVHGNQTRIAELAGVRQGTVSDALSHGSAGMKLLSGLARVGETTVDAILDGTALEPGLAPAHDAPTRAVVPLPGEARPGDTEAWRTLEEDPVFATFARGRLAVAATPLDREQTTAALNYAARRLPRNYGGGEAELTEVRRLYREGLAIVRDEDLVELPPKVPERAAPTPAPPAPRLTMKEKAAKLAEAKKSGKRG